MSHMKQQHKIKPWKIVFQIIYTGYYYIASAF